MKLTVNLKAMKNEGRNKAESKPRIVRSKGCLFTRYGSNIAADGDYVYAFNFEKHRKKSQRFGAAGQRLKKARITPAKWVCHYYRIPIALLDAMNLKVMQGSRTFKIVPQ